MGALLSNLKTRFGRRVFFIAYAGGLLGKITASVFLAVCTALAIGPDQWAGFIVSGMPAITPSEARIAFAILAFFTFLPLVHPWTWVTPTAKAKSRITPTILEKAPTVPTLTPAPITPSTGKPETASIKIEAVYDADTATISVLSRSGVHTCVIEPEAGALITGRYQCTIIPNAQGTYGVTVSNQRGQSTSASIIFGVPSVSNVQNQNGAVKFHLHPGGKSTTLKIVLTPQVKAADAPTPAPPPNNATPRVEGRSARVEFAYDEESKKYLVFGRTHISFAAIDPYTYDPRDWALSGKTMSVFGNLQKIRIKMTFSSPVYAVLDGKGNMEKIQQTGEGIVIIYDPNAFNPFSYSTVLSFNDEKAFSITLREK